MLVVTLLLGGCKSDGVVVTDTADTSDPTATQRLAIGSACDEPDLCVQGAVCASTGVCAAVGDPGTLPFGEECAASSECQLSLVCASDGTCAPEGGVGTLGVGESCATAEDCQATLSCYESQCVGFDMPLWDGVECVEDSPPFRVLYEVPRGAPTGEDFFRMPFPSDAIVGSSGPVMDGFPSSAPDFPVLGSAVDGYTAAFAEDFLGFGSNQTVIFRLSGLPDFDTVLVGGPDAGNTFFVVDVTEGDPAYGTPHPVGWKLTTNLPYLCDPWMALYPAVGRPFLPGHTYAAVITTGLLAQDGSAPAVDADFTAMLGGPPADSALQAAWEAHAPLRDWVVSTGFTTPLAAGTVFTIAHPPDAITRTRNLIRSTPPPVASSVFTCDGTPGPLVDAADPTRGCFDVSPNRHEVQGLLPVPLLQSGTPPFKTPADGGTTDWSLGQPTIDRTGELPFAITLPVGPAPPEGWPVVLFAHGGGQNYRSFVEKGLAEALDPVDLGGGNAVRFAVIGIDTWLTGPRRGAEDPAWALDPAAYDPWVLHHNPLNPAAARDTLAQSAVDWFQVVRWLETVDWTGPASPVGEDVVFDLDRLYFVGHDVGAGAGTLLLAHEPRVEAGVLANATAFWTGIVSEPGGPVHLSTYLAPALADGAVDRFHPVIQLGQGIVDRTDPVSHARFVHQDVAAADAHVLQLVVPDDPRVPLEAQRALARGLFVEQIVQPGVLPLEQISEIAAPQSANVGPTTAVAVVNTASDPHDALFSDARSLAQWTHFLGTAARDGTPTVPVAP